MRCSRPSAAGDLTVSLPDGLTTLDGIQLQLTPTNLVCPNVQISGIDPSNINNITLQVTPPSVQRGFFLAGGCHECNAASRVDRRWVILLCLDKKKMACPWQQQQMAAAPVLFYGLGRTLYLSLLSITANSVLSALNVTFFHFV